MHKDTKIGYSHVGVKATPDEVEAVVRLFALGMSNSRIAHEVGLHRNTVKAIQDREFGDVTSRPRTYVLWYLNNLLRDAKTTKDKLMIIDRIAKFQDTVITDEVDIDRWNADAGVDD